jgi:YVTN family beta-propeller protein
MPTPPMRRPFATLAVIAAFGLGTLSACADGDDQTTADAADRSASASAAPTTSSPAPTATHAATKQPPRHDNRASAPLRGMPPVTDPDNIYAAAGPGMLSDTVKHVPYRIYVPNSEASSVTVINPRTMHIIRTFPVAENPQHVVPSYDMKSLYATNDRGNSLTKIDPRTGKRVGADLPVTDPYNMYYTPDGRYAIVVSEALQTLYFRDPDTFKVRDTVRVSCPGVDHIDFSANGGYLIATCEFSSRLVKINLHTHKVMGYLQLPSGSSPQDIKLDPTGRIFYVADRYKYGVWLIKAATFKRIGFVPTAADAHGLYPSRDAKFLYITNRGAGSVSVLRFATRKVVHTWHIPGGGSPDMGNTSPNGKVLWLAGRYNSTVYALSTRDGHLIGRIGVGLQPHGLCVWPQPGRYSLGHTGVTR